MSPCLCVPICDQLLDHPPPSLARCSGSVRSTALARKRCFGFSEYVSHAPVLVQDNLLHGRFLAEVTQEVFADLEDTKYQHTEYRISIYGRKTVEWDILAAWVCQNKLYSDKNVWLIQVQPCCQLTLQSTRHSC